MKIFIFLFLVSCTSIEVTSTNDGCQAKISRNMLTEMILHGFEAKCDPKTKTLELVVDKQSQSTQSDVLEAVARGAAEGAKPGP